MIATQSQTKNIPEGGKYLIRSDKQLGWAGLAGHSRVTPRLGEEGPFLT